MVDIALEDWRQISVDHRGVAAPDQLHQRADLMADRDLAEADFARQFRNLRFVIGEAVSVHEDNCGRANAAVKGGLQPGASLGDIQRHVDCAVHHDPLNNFDDARVKQCRLDDMQVKNARAGLIANLQGIAKSLGGDQNRCVALALQQRVGGNRSTHFDGGNQVRRDRRIFRHLQKPANAGQRRVAIGFGVLRQQFAGGQ